MVREQSVESFYSKLRQSVSASSSSPLLIFPSTSDADSLCALKIIFHVLESDSVRYACYPVSSFDEIHKFTGPNLCNSASSDTEPISILLINWGCHRDLRKVLNLGSAARVFVVDSHRPIHLHNVSDENDRVIVLYTRDDEHQADLACDYDVTALANASDLNSDDEVRGGGSDSEDDDNESQSEDEDGADDDAGVGRRKRRRVSQIFIGGISKVLTSKTIASVFGTLKAYRFQVNEDLDEQFAFLEYVDHLVTPRACAGLNGMKLGGKVLTAVQAFPNAQIAGVGLKMDDALAFWKAEFSHKIGSKRFDKEYAYSIRHNYGREGKRTDYTPFSCQRIISTSPGVGDHHGCPYQHFRWFVMIFSREDYLASLRRKSRVVSLEESPEGSPEVPLELI